ncbi:DNA polymerase III subunit beta [Spongiactinospora sp. TRM90649]|uniref:DNA polymerase III subunit beta n=1 Tax=Spongiactinospora sp. TRM90649 TaxID=3031114 RepID=UPI0023F7B5BC|nr:DNA polymerase III subunit beta [Spongiactinospora sp. TRM90649]MDF5755798.1 DNA polymerase III subunit beta [Spongiactinospora sp. TRM90649]
MKATFDAKTLADAVTWTARHIPARPTTPVLTGILITANEGEATLSAFDYDVSARATLPAVVAEPGTVLVPGRIFAEVVKSLPAGHPVETGLSGTDLSITCGGVEFTLPTLPVDDYPTLPDAPATVGTMQAEDLRRAVTHVAPAASKDPTIPALTGIRLDATGQDLHLAATDRYRIAADTLPWQPAGDIGHLIPAAILSDLAKTLGHGPVELGIADDGGLAAITHAGRTTTVRLLDPEYIDYEPRLNPEQMTTWGECDLAPLTTAVRRVALVADRGTAVRLAFTAGQVQVLAGGGDSGRGTETLPADLGGAPIEVAFQPGFLLDGLGGITADRVRIGMTGPGKAVLFLGADNDTFRYLLQAVRLS